MTVSLTTLFGETISAVTARVLCGVHFWREIFMKLNAVEFMSKNLFQTHRGLDIKQYTAL